jgi:hypothetical protein
MYFILLIIYLTWCREFLSRHESGQEDPTPPQMPLNFMKYNQKNAINIVYFLLS